MAPRTDKEWADHALTALSGAGFRRGGARTAVVEALAAHDCAVSALELDDQLRAGEAPPGRASVYRALDQLEELGLLRRIEVTRGTAAYERVKPSGHHHHHAICRICGRMETFEDRALEKAIARVSDGMSFEISEHDVVLRGLCERCAASGFGAGASG